MARVEIASLGLGLVVDSAGNSVSSRDVAITTSSGGAATVYASATGASTVTPTTGANGYIPGFLNPGRYTFTIGGTSHTQDVVSGSTPSLDVTTYGATGDGVTDDTTAFTAAFTAAGDGGTVVIGPGTFIVSDAAFSNHRQRLVGAGWGTVLKAKSGATYALRVDSKLNCTVENLVIDGNSKASSGLLIRATNATSSSQGHTCRYVRFQNALVGVEVTGTTGGPPSDQVDKNAYYDCIWETCTTGMYIHSTNAQEQLVQHFSFNTCDTGIRLSNGDLVLRTGQFQYNSAAFKGIVLDGVNTDWLSLDDVITEGPGGNTCTDIDASGNGWPVMGVLLEQCVLAGGGGIKMGTIGGGGVIPVLVARRTRFNTGTIDTTVSDAVFDEHYCEFNTGATWNPTGAAASSSHHHKWDKYGYWHYLGTALKSRINNAGEHVSDDATKGFVLKDTQGSPHYWRVTVSNVGALVITDAGTTRPD